MIGAAFLDNQINRVGLTPFFQHRGFVQKHVDSDARIRLTDNFGKFLLDRFGGVERGVAELEAGDAQRRGLEVELLDGAVAVGIADNLVL